RRLAARAAAMRMASGLGERLGARVGLRARMMTETSASTRIEVITEGVFTRLILDDPELAGIGLVIFDEFHERSLDADFGLALAVDAQEGLREDLRLLIMSATLDGARVADRLGGPRACPVVESQGRSFPVETYYLGRDQAARLETEVLRAVNRAMRETDGSVLVFLPGQREIGRAEQALADAIVDRRAEVVTLFGAMDRTAQDSAIAPPDPGVRKIILATAIAETSLTLEGVTAVVDSGLAREPRYDVGARLTRLATVRVSRAAADQRRGRAGRIGPGVCYRLWSEPETQSLAPFATPEILSSDLTGVILDCAVWGIASPELLTWLDPPPAAAVEAATSDLRTLGALDDEGRVTPFGAVIRNLPLPPTLAAMVCRSVQYGAAGAAAKVAALLVERGLGGNATDLDERLDRFMRERGPRARAMRDLAARWSKAAGAAMATVAGHERQPRDQVPSTAGLLSLAYPDRIARRRTAGDGGEYLMAGGSAGVLAPDDPLRGHRYLVVADLQGAARAGRITAAAAIDEAEIELIAGPRIEKRVDLSFDRPSLSVRARRERRLGALVLDSDSVPISDPVAASAVLAGGIAEIGVAVLPWTKAQNQLRARVAFLRRADPEAWPDLSSEALSQSVGTWLAPVLTGKAAVRDITADDLALSLDVLIGWNLRQKLDARAPTHFMAPTGNRHPIAYEGEQAPSISLRVQELFGLNIHPAIDGGRLPLTLFLLSPAHRPIQVTRDLPGFWAGSWADVRADLRGRYPKHPWPEDPANAEPTSRAKPRR
ncbi:MAG: ATP-dependent helicase HrpB, partial [Alphaproteobacteria bacterium]|nr:ATP-dependent helicase HrpB [Alphaproteobacteria bacterium]